MELKEKTACQVKEETELTAKKTRQRQTGV